MIFSSRAITRLFSICAAAASLATAPFAFAEIHTDGREIAPGKNKLEVVINDKPTASFIYGSKELKPYLNVHAPDGTLVTEWDASQPFPHHRGIYIGWNRITSDIGRFDLWHFNNGGEMVVRSISTASSSDSQFGERAILQAVIEWKATPKGEKESFLLLTEDRKMVISPSKDGTQVDATFRLKAARDLTLGGDLQHSGIHFRASHTVAPREKETSYLWDPPVEGPGGKVKSEELKWARFFFPIGDKWYSAMELNHPDNPVKELSWRTYGRFGFFFPKELKKDETLELKFRFLVSAVDKPTDARHSPEELARYKAPSEAIYKRFISEIPSQTNHN